MDLTMPLGVDGEFGLVFGTSASSPVMASMVTLINDARLAAGKGPVGEYQWSLGRIVHPLTRLADRIYQPCRKQHVSIPSTGLV